jgi:hypothetical protein
VPSRRLKPGPWEPAEDPRVYVRPLQQRGSLTGGIVGYQAATLRPADARATFCKTCLYSFRANARGVILPHTCRVPRRSRLRSGGARPMGGDPFPTRAAAIQAARNLLDGAEPVATLTLPGISS